VSPYESVDYDGRTVPSHSDDKRRRFLHLSCFRVARSGEVVLDVGTGVGVLISFPTREVFETLLEPQELNAAQIMCLVDRGTSSIRE
jgi:hypothetical protein